jgi:hypothetical protein
MAALGLDLLDFFKILGLAAILEWAKSVGFGQWPFGPNGAGRTMLRVVPYRLANLVLIFAGFAIVIGRVTHELAFAFGTLVIFAVVVSFLLLRFGK